MEDPAEPELLPGVQERKGPPRLCFACGHVGFWHGRNGACWWCPCREYISDKEQGQPRLI